MMAIMRECIMWEFNFETLKVARDSRGDQRIDRD